MRFITRQIDRPELLGAYEEALLLSRINETTPDTIWLWRHPRVMYLLRSALIEYMDIDYAKQCGYSVIRSAIFPARPTSIVIAGNDFGLSVYCKGLETDSLIQNYYVGFWKFVCGGLVDLEHTGNDLVVKGTSRKILGMVNTQQGGVAAGHCMFSETVPGVDLEMMFKMPLEKFDDKEVKTVSDRITSFFKETGTLVDDQWLNSKAVEYFGNMGIQLNTENDFNTAEYDLVETLKAKHLSQEWITRGDILSVTDPMEAFQKYISNTNLAEEDDIFLRSIFGGKLPTAEKELRDGIAVRRKYGNN